MKETYKNVMQPIRIGNHLIKNRIIAAPVTLHSHQNGELHPTEAAIEFFVQRARAGSGIVVCGGAKLLPQKDDGEHANWDLYKHNEMHKLAELAERIHFYGAKASMELIGIFDDGYVACEGGLLMDGKTPGREIPISEMERYKEGFAHSAEALMNLGYDGLVLHFGHCIPIAQFLSPYVNKRKDQYGGSFENRTRYLIEILEAIRKRVGNRMFIEIRMSADEFQEGGIDLEEGIKIAEVFQKYADIIQASCGMITPELMCRTHPCDFLPPNPNVYLAEAFKKSGKIKVPVTGLGGIGSLEDADEIIASGKADFVAMSRSLIADPELITKSLAGKPEDIVPCVKCMRCHDSTVYGHYFQCTVNPTIGMMHNMHTMVAPAGEAKKVAVIGGGPAGMYAALTAADRGHDVTLFEKSDNLGGILRTATATKFKYSLAKFMNYLVDHTNKSDVKVKLNTEVTPESLKSKGYDAVIAALGATPFILPVPGSDAAVNAVDIYGIEDKLGDNVIVLGGGEVGCETALHLAQMGKKATIIEMQSELAPDSSPSHRGDLLFQLQKEANLTAVTGAKCSAITKENLTYEKDGKSVTIHGDSVVMAVGMVAKTKEADAFAPTAPYFREIGDCVRPRTAEMAVREGYFAGVNI